MSMQLLQQWELDQRRGGGGGGGGVGNASCDTKHIAWLISSKFQTIQLFGSTFDFWSAYFTAAATCTCITYPRENKHILNKRPSSHLLRSSCTRVFSEFEHAQLKCHMFTINFSEESSLVEQLVTLLLAGPSTGVQLNSCTSYLLILELSNCRSLKLRQPRTRPHPRKGAWKGLRMRQNSQKTWDKKCFIVLRFSYLRP